MVPKEIEIHQSVWTLQKLFTAYGFFDVDSELLPAALPTKGSGLAFPMSIVTQKCTVFKALSYPHRQTMSEKTNH